MLPERLTKPDPESEEDVEEREKLQNITRDYTANLELGRQKAQEIIKTHT